MMPGSLSTQHCIKNAVAAHCFPIGNDDYMESRYSDIIFLNFLIILVCV